MAVALVVGHKASARGARNQELNISEYGFNDQLARDISDKSNEIDTVVIYRDTYKGLPEDLNDINPEFIFSLHCNAFNRQASGTEVLYYHTSELGKRIATVFQKNLVKTLDLKDRGTKGKSAEDRGGYLLRYTSAPCIICEPFFIDSLTDFKTAKRRYKSLVAAYVSAIEESIKILL